MPLYNSHPPFIHVHNEKAKGVEAKPDDVFPNMISWRTEWKCAKIQAPGLPFTLDELYALGLAQITE